MFKEQILQFKFNFTDKRVTIENLTSKKWLQTSNR